MSVALSATQLEDALSRAAEHGCTVHVRTATREFFAISGTPIAGELAIVAEDDGQRLDLVGLDVVYVWALTFVVGTHPAGRVSHDIAELREALAAGPKRKAMDDSLVAPSRAAAGRFGLRGFATAAVNLLLRAGSAAPAATAAATAVTGDDDNDRGGTWSEVGVTPIRDEPLADAVGYDEEGDLGRDEEDDDGIAAAAAPFLRARPGAIGTHTRFASGEREDDVTRTFAEDGLRDAAREQALLNERRLRQELRERDAQLQQVVEEADTAYFELCAERDELVAQVAELQQQREAAQQRNAADEETAVKLRRRLDRAKAERDDDRALAQRATADVADLREQLAQAARDKSAAGDELATLRAEHESLRAELATLRAEHESLRAEREKARADARAAAPLAKTDASELRAIRRQLADVTAQRDALATASSGVTTRRQAAQSAAQPNAASADELAAANEQLAQLRAALASREARANEARSAAATAARATADRQHATAMGEQRRQHELALATLRAELEEARADADRNGRAVAEALRAADERARQAREQLTRSHAAAAETARREHEQALAALRASLASSRPGKADDAAMRERDLLRRQLADAEQRAQQAALSAANELAHATAARDAALRNVRAADEQRQTLERRLAAAAAPAAAMASPPPRPPADTETARLLAEARAANDALTQRLAEATAQLAASRRRVGGATAAASMTATGEHAAVTQLQASVREVALLTQQLADLGVEKRALERQLSESRAICAELTAANDALVADVTAARRAAATSAVAAAVAASASSSSQATPARKSRGAAAAAATSSQETRSSTRSGTSDDSRVSSIVTGRSSSSSSDDERAARRRLVRDVKDQIIRHALGGRGMEEQADAMPTRETIPGIDTMRPSTWAHYERHNGQGAFITLLKSNLLIGTHSPPAVIDAVDKLHRFVSNRRDKRHFNKDERLEGVLLWLRLYAETKIAAAPQAEKTKLRADMQRMIDYKARVETGNFAEEELLQKSKKALGTKETIKEKGAPNAAKTGGAAAAATTKGGKQLRGKRGGKKEGGQGGSGSALQQ